MFCEYPCEALILRITKKSNQTQYVQLLFVWKADSAVQLIKRKRIPKVLSNGNITSWSVAFKGEHTFEATNTGKLSSKSKNSYQYWSIYMVDSSDQLQTSSVH